MRITRRHLAALAAPLIAAAVGTSTVSADTGWTSALAGATTVTISPAVTGALVGADILPTPVRPATERLVASPGLEVQATFPITGGMLQGLSGDIQHGGGLTFVHPAAGATLTITRFDIVLGAHPHITAYVPALGTRTTVFTLDLSHATVRHTSYGTVVGNVRVALPWAGVAGVLNSALRTSAFHNGMVLGTARVVLETSY